jgi:hypothetical protein
MSPERDQNAPGADPEGYQCEPLPGQSGTKILLSRQAGNYHVPHWGARWLLWPCGDGMEQLNTFVLYELGANVRGCYLYGRYDFPNWSQVRRTSIDLLNVLLQADPNTFRLNESRNAALGLVRELERIEQLAAGGQQSLTDHEAIGLNNACWLFDSALSLELGRAPIFFVTPKGIYDTTRLIADAAAALEGFQDHISPGAVADTNQAGRCLAFTLPTAAGFHIARATETVIKQFVRAHGKKVGKSWGAYIAALTEGGANQAIVHHIQQLKDLHRNPMIHPEITLTMIEAHSLWSMCISVIQAMVFEMKSIEALHAPPAGPP